MESTVLMRDIAGGKVNVVHFFGDCTYSCSMKYCSMIRIACFGLVLGLLAPTVFAEESVNYRLSGFASLVAGSTVSGMDDAVGNPPGCNAPCYVADWNNGGAYGSHPSLRPESRVGVQGTWVVTPELSATAQVTARAVESRARIEWGYLSYKSGPWDIQVGRKRIPLYYYSEFQDIGVAYPWVAPPPDLYGWEVTNYNGASLRYRDTVGEVGISASIFGGAEKLKAARYYKMLSTDLVDVEWQRLLGADLELVRDWLTFRLAYAQANVVEQYRQAGQHFGHKMSALNLAVNMDFGRWFVLTEVGELARRYVDGDDTRLKVLSALLGVGVRYGAWTPMLTLSRFHEHAVVAGYNDPDYVADRWNTLMASVRYDLKANQALKFQVNRTQDTTGRYTGNTTTIRLSYDVVF